MNSKKIIKFTFVNLLFFLMFISGINCQTASSELCSHFIKNINSEKNESFAPMIIVDDIENTETLFFTSSAQVPGKSDRAFNRDIFMATREIASCGLSVNAEWSSPSYISWANDVSDKFKLYNKSSITAYKDYFIVAVEISDTGDTSSKAQTDLYTVEFKNGKFTNPRPIRELNDPKANDDFPTVSLDGTTLFFSSDRKGGRGGYDIYYSQMTNFGWSKPQPVSSINSRVDEITPHCASDGNFYFSSNWDFERYSLSAKGKEIFVSEFKRNMLPSYPKNLNSAFKGKSTCHNQCKEYNTKADEAYPFVSPDGTYLYISSNKNGNSKEYHIFSYLLRKPKIALKVNILENIMGSDGKKINSKMINDKVQIALTDWNGVKKVYNANSTIYLEPNCIFDIEPMIDPAECLAGNFQVIGGSTIETSIPDYCDTFLVKEFSFVKDIISENAGLDNSNFIEGYWKPMIYDNYTEYRNRVDSGYFKESPFVNTAFNEKSKVYKIENNTSEIYVKIDKMIRDYYDCLRDKDLFLRISLIARYDDKIKQAGVYPDKTVTINGVSIEQGKKIYPGANANVTLSKLRAAHTKEAITDMMQRRSNFYNALEKSGKIYYEIYGAGKSTDQRHTGSDNNAIDIVIDVAGKDWMDNNHRIDSEAPIIASYNKELETKNDTEKKVNNETENTSPPKVKIEEKTKSITNKTNKITPVDNKPRIKETTAKPDNKIVEKPIKKDDKKIVEADSKTIKNPEVKKPVVIKKDNKKPDKKKATDLAVNKKVTKEPIKKVSGKSTKKPTVSKKKGSRTYTISFGSYRRKSNSDNLAKFLETNNVPGLRVLPVTIRNRQYYRVRSGVFNSWNEAKQYAREYARMLRKARVRAPAKVIIE